MAGMEGETKMDDIISISISFIPLCRLPKRDFKIDNMCVCVFVCVSVQDCEYAT